MFQRPTSRAGNRTHTPPTQSLLALDAADTSDNSEQQQQQQQQGGRRRWTSLSGLAAGFVKKSNRNLDESSNQNQNSGSGDDNSIGASERKRRHSEKKPHTPPATELLLQQQRRTTPPASQILIGNDADIDSSTSSSSSSSSSSSQKHNRKNIVEFDSPAAALMQISDSGFDADLRYLSRCFPRADKDVIIRIIASFTANPSFFPMEGPVDAPTDRARRIHTAIRKLTEMDAMGSSNLEQEALLAAISAAEAADKAANVISKTRAALSEGTYAAQTPSSSVDNPSSSPLSRKLDLKDSDSPVGNSTTKSESIHHYSSDHVTEKPDDKDSIAAQASTETTTSTTVPTRPNRPQSASPASKHINGRAITARTRKQMEQDEELVHSLEEEERLAATANISFGKVDGGSGLLFRDVVFDSNQQSPNIEPKIVLDVSKTPSPASMTPKSQRSKMRLHQEASDQSSVASSKLSSVPSPTLSSSPTDAAMMKNDRMSRFDAGESDDSDENEVDDDGDIGGRIGGSRGGGASSMPANGSEIQELFAHISSFKPATVELPSRLALFIPEYIPTVGDIDPFIHIPPANPSANKEKVCGLHYVNEPSGAQSDPAVLGLALRSETKGIEKSLRPTITSVDPVANPRAINNWIEGVNNMHRNAGPIAKRQTKTMPDIEKLMQAWPTSIEDALEQIKLPTCDLQVSLEEYCRLALALIGIPVYPQPLTSSAASVQEKTSLVSSLQVMFELYAEFKRSQHFGVKEQVRAVIPPRTSPVENEQATSSASS